MIRDYETKSPWKFWYVFLSWRCKYSSSRDLNRWDYIEDDEPCVNQYTYSSFFFSLLQIIYQMKSLALLGTPSNKMMQSMFTCIQHVLTGRKRRPHRWRIVETVQTNCFGNYRKYIGISWCFPHFSNNAQHTWMEHTYYYNYLFFNRNRTEPQISK